MFPSHGYFYSVNCPDYLEGKCFRTYCHFNHNEKLQHEYKNKPSASSKLPEIESHSLNAYSTSRIEQNLTSVSIENVAVVDQQEAINSGPVFNTTVVTTSQDSNLEQIDEFETLRESSEINFDTNYSSPQQMGSLSIQKKTEILDTETEPNENKSDILHHLISEAVKKVLSENSNLSSALLDPNTIAKSLDTDSLVAKAIKEVSVNTYAEDTAKEKKHVNTYAEDTSKEKKQPRLYLPPPGTPSYKPTPISELKIKSLKNKDITLPLNNEEYTPTPISNNVSSNDGDITDFSTDEEENDNEARSDFDMLEEVLVERSSDPVRKKAILKRKKALGKLSSTNISSKPPLSINKTNNSKDKTNIEDKSTQKEVMNEPVSVTDTFHPPSPLFTSSSETAIDISIPSNFKECVNDASCSKDIPEESSHEEPLKLKSLDENEKVTENLPSVSKSCSVASTHNLLPQIAELSRPNIKSWSPVAKVDTLLSVEKMLEQLDSLPAERKIPSENASLKVGTTQNLEVDDDDDDDKKSDNSEDVNQCVENSYVNESLPEGEGVSSFHNDSQEKCSKEKDNQNESDSSHQKRSFDSENSSDREKKRRKVKKSHHSKRRQKKHKRRASSSYSEEESFSSESDEEVTHESSEEESSSGEKHSRKRKKRSKHRKHKSKSLYHKRSKSKHKRNKDYKRSRSRSRSSHRKKSYHHSSDNNSSNNSTSSPAKSPSESRASPVCPDKVLLDNSQIKKEKIDFDIAIVKIEKQVATQNKGKPDAVNNSASSVVEPSTKSITSKDSSNVNPINMECTTKEVSVSISALQTIKEKLDVVKENVGKCSSSSSVKASTSVPSEDKDIPNSNDSIMVASSSTDKNSKPKVLKEFSIFEGLSEPSHKKITPRRSFTSEKTSTSKNKDEGRRTSEKTPEAELKCTSSLATKNLRCESSPDKQNVDKVQSSHKKYSSHTSHRNKGKERKNSSSENYSKDSHKSKVSKELEKHKEGRTSSSNDKSRSISHSKSKSSKSSDSKSHKRSESERKRPKEAENEKDPINDAKKGKKEKDTKEPSKSKVNLPVKELESTGSDSPIPDLSALDELPKEDWDQLLSGSNDKIGDSDTDEGVDFDPDPFDVSIDTDDVNDPKVLEECMRVFSEYTPEETRQPTVPKKDQSKNVKDNDKIDVPTRKSRVAHFGASGNLIEKPKALIKPRRKTPAEVMLERYQKLKEEELLLQKKLEIQRKELAKHGQVPPPLAISSSSVSSTSDPPSSAVSSSTAGLPKKRIARAPSNVIALLKSKEKLIMNTLNNKTASVTTSEPEPKTLATTNVKGQKRVAHTPKIESLQRPVVSTEAGTKVPQNIRQRYLNCFIDETLKFCDGEEHAYNVALAEESICHKRATTRMVYLNLAVNVLKKLRACQISEAAQELLENDPKYKTTKGRLYSSSSAVSSSSSAKKNLEHPINPNHRTVSHFSVMASGGQKGSWSIQKPKKSLPDNIKDYFKGVKFYKCLKKYILTAEFLDENGFPRPDPSIKGKAVVKRNNFRKKISPNEQERYCDRCSVLYEVDQWGFPVLSSSCVYHWGRAYKRRGIGGLEMRYSCCQGDSQSEGCSLGTTHVSENYSPDSLRGYVRTIPKEPDTDGDYGVFALDCEMCYTTGGSELTRITVINSNNKPVYETLVKPDNPVIDYNTRFSGITEEDLEGVSVTLRDVQAALLTRFSEKTIVMGHSLESDFSALKLIHDTVVDTSIVFPHKLGSPFKRALRNLASEYLTKIIQNDEGGHDSAEDAITCMELMHWKIKEDLKGQV